MSALESALKRVESLEERCHMLTRGSWCSLCEMSEGCSQSQHHENDGQVAYPERGYDK